MKHRVKLVGFRATRTIEKQKIKILFLNNKTKENEKCFLWEKKISFFSSITRKNEFSLFELSIFNNKIVQKESYLAIII